MNVKTELDHQLQLILDEYRSGNIKDVHEALKLINMAYHDWIDFHPEEKVKMQRQMYGDLMVSRKFQKK